MQRSFYALYFCAPGCRLFPSQSVGLSVRQSASGSPGAPLRSLSRPETIPRHLTFFLRGLDRIMRRWFPCGTEAAWKEKQNRKLTCSCVQEGNVPPLRNVCYQPGTGSDRRTKPSRSRGGIAAGRRDPAAADRLRHPGLGRDAQPGPVSPLSIPDSL